MHWLLWLQIESISSPQWAQSAWRRCLADILPLSCDLCSDRGQRLAEIRPCVLITHSLYSFLPLIRASPLWVCLRVCVSVHVFPSGAVQKEGGREVKIVCGLVPSLLLLVLQWHSSQSS